MPSDMSPCSAQNRARFTYSTAHGHRMRLMSSSGWIAYPASTNASSSRSLTTPLRAEHLPGQLPEALGVPLGPPPLLQLEGAHVLGELVPHQDVLQVAPVQSLERAPVGQVEILGQRVGGPPAGLLDRLPAPDAGGAVERRDVPHELLGRLLDGEVPVEQERQRGGKQALDPAPPRPPGLHERHRRIVEGRVSSRSRFRKLGSGTKSASNSATNSASDRSSPSASAPALYPVRWVRRTCSMRTPSLRTSSTTAATISLVSSVESSSTWMSKRSRG
jgi:hypothetical protein